MRGFPDADPSLLRCTFKQALQNQSLGIFGSTNFVRLALEQLHRDDPLANPWIKDYTQHQENGMLLESTSRDWQHWQHSILVGASCP